MLVAVWLAVLAQVGGAEALSDAGAADDAGVELSDAGGALDAGSAEVWADDSGVAAADAGVDGGAADGGQEDNLHRSQTVVTGTRTPSKLEDAVVPTEVITRAQIESYGVRDLGQLLGQQPGVEVFYTFRGAGIRLQGLDPEYVLILVDGERVTGRVGNTVDLSRFSLRDVDRIEIVKGPASALYGADAIGGVINLITRRVAKPVEGALRFQLGNSFREGQNNDWDLRGHGGAKAGPFEIRIGGGLRGVSGYDLDPNDAATNGPGFFRFDGDVAAYWNPHPTFELRARTGYLRRDSAAVDVAPTGAVFDRRNRTEQFDVSAGATWKPLDRTRLEGRFRFGLFRDQLQQDQRGATYLDAYSQNVDRLYEGTLQLDQGFGAHAISLGAEVLSEALLSSRLAGNFASRIRVSGFIQDEWTPDTTNFGDVKMKVLPGFRYDHDSQFGGAFTPRLALKLDPWPWLAIRASYGAGFRPPSFQELYLEFENSSVGYVVRGNSELKAETSQGINVSVDVKLPLEGWLVSLSGFNTWINNLINVDTSQPVDPDNPALFTYANVDQAVTQGLEASLRARLSAGAYVDVGYTLLNAYDVLTGRYLEGRAAHRWNAAISARYRPIGFEATVRANLVSSRPFYDLLDADGQPTVVWADPYCTLDLQITYRFRSLFSIFVGVNNLLGAGDAKYLPLPPRHFYLGAQVQY
jgi:outer membrane receptor for ferrienterochelin and colicins